ncbi:YwqG family protein [Tunicatimonas pelagia]|uniref:YwqG family protein n=1 Tax=Tunicatimonas pelagia TaxID=931531 RepID=UPI002666DEC0|nr:DUF1963 domain-containing protein [Tunicatimonas pelagia]WKN40609.1 DUF1963 domain-containing protein [Tunicatimonas pelagia]
MIPDFLKEYEADLKKYERKFVRIKAKSRKELPLEDKLDVKESKFLGIPFFPRDKEYPKDRTGQPMVMTAQLNFEQIPFLQDFPKSGILQLFISKTDWYDDDAKVIYHSEEELRKPTLSDFSFLSNDDYDDMPIIKLHQLTFKKGVDKGGSEDSQFDYLFGQDDYWDFSESLTEEQQVKLGKYFDASGHKIGGYADFTQSDPRDYSSERKEDIQVLQIDVDDHIMFGDSGLGHIFIAKENLIERNFSKAYFYWDCC